MWSGERWTGGGGDRKSRGGKKRDEGENGAVFGVLNGKPHFSTEA